MKHDKVLKTSLNHLDKSEKCAILYGVVNHGYTLTMKGI